MSRPRGRHGNEGHRRSLFDRRSIRYPLARLIAMAVVIGIGLALLSYAVLMLDNVRGDIRRTLGNAGNAAGTTASAAVVFRDAKAAREALRMFKAYPEVEAAALYTQQGARLASYGEAGLLPADVSGLPPEPPAPRLMDAATSLRLPIVVDEATVGTVYLRARLGAYWRTYLASLATTFLVTLGAGALALIFAMRFLNRIIQPIRLLAEAANDARLRQDFTPRAIPVADNEIGDLVGNFNALLAEVEAGRASLQSQQSHLEGLVAERTAELLAAKDSADAANAAKSRFLAAASHDLRQPIHAMRLFLDTLSGTSLNEEQRRIANYLSLSTRSLADILNTLLDVSRLDGGGVKPRLEVVPALDLLRDIEAEFAPLALVKGLRFQFFFPDRELMLHTDRKLLYSLLRNLIDNAIKYTEQGGVLVGFRRRQGHALIQVWDTGIGIAPEHRAAIFDEYFQAANPQRDRSRGLGLGLAIARRVADTLGGRIECRSRPGRGSLFEISVPLADAAGALADVAPGLAAPGGIRAGAGRVVLVEDDPMAAKALEMALRARGMAVAVYPDAEAALADPHIAEADFYIVDFRLPGSNGIRFLDTLQARAARPLKATLLTGETPQEVAIAATASAWPVMRKPADTTALLAAIEASRNAT